MLMGFIMFGTVVLARYVLRESVHLCPQLACVISSLLPVVCLCIKSNMFEAMCMLNFQSQPFIPMAVSP